MGLFNIHPYLKKFGGCKLNRTRFDHLEQTDLFVELLLLDAADIVNNCKGFTALLILNERFKIHSV